MEYEVALQIITSLSEGFHPKTGERLPEDSCFNSPETIRALYSAREALQLAIKSQQKKRLQPTNAGKPWTPDEDQHLLALFDSGKTMTEISEQHMRSKGSIKARLVRLGRITD